jgi:hypothetical protein
MIKRVVAVMAPMAAAAAVVLAAAPASAQTYPPPVRSITVDDATPAAGQSITITLQTCRARTVALLGIDLDLVAAPRVGADGVAEATVTVPPRIRPGRHRVAGLCLDPELRPLFLTTVITVGAPDAGGSGPGAGGPGGAGGTGTPPDGGPASAGPGDGAVVGTPAGGVGAGAGQGGGATLADLRGPTVPAGAADLFAGTAAANGLDKAGPAAPGDGGVGDAERSGAARPNAGDSDPGLLATIARVLLGLAAVGGVPAALAFSRRPRPVVRQGFT